MIPSGVIDMIQRYTWRILLVLVLAGAALIVSVGRNVRGADPEAARKITVREMELAEQVVASRKAYRDNLLKLLAFYTDNGYDETARVVRKELEALEKIPDNFYIVAVVGIDTVDPAEFREIPAATKLFEQGMEQKNFPDLFTKKQHLEKALKRFKEILIRYPESNLCPETAYRIAQIYRGFYYNDKYRALKYYEACLEWAPEFPYKVRWRIADIYDKYLNNYGKAVKYYRLSVAKDPEDFANKSRERLAQIEKMAEEGKIVLEEGD